MAKPVLIACVLLSLIIGNGWDAEAAQRTVRKDKSVEINYRVGAKVREPRFVNPFYGFISLWNTLGEMYRLYAEQKNETKSAFEQTYDIVADGFNDTYMATKRPTTTETSTGTDPTTTTVKYRITRKEFGYILGRNYRGLKKLLNIEWNDALNQSKYNIQEYKEEKGNALAPYTVPKGIPPQKVFFTG